MCICIRTYVGYKTRARQEILEFIARTMLLYNIRPNGVSLTKTMLFGKHRMCICRVRTLSYAC
jgi:hypothetical protein